MFFLCVPFQKLLLLHHRSISAAFLLKVTSLSSITSFWERRQVIKDSLPQNLGPCYSSWAPPLFSFLDSLQCPEWQCIYCLRARAITGPAVQSLIEYTSEFYCSMLHMTEVLIPDDSVPALPGRLLNRCSFFFKVRQHFPSPGFIEDASFSL